ncbi:MAG: hypothetical protein L6R40_004092 [Gallowayella cf. fulva]|nr:MAG: hypothetical protein L6R40_004092 [Xanthomendoza cf. fulva]
MSQFYGHSDSPKDLGKGVYRPTPLLLSKPFSVPRKFTLQIHQQLEQPYTTNQIAIKLPLPYKSSAMPPPPSFTSVYRGEVINLLMSVLAYSSYHQKKEANEYKECPQGLPNQDEDDTPKETAQWVDKQSWILKRLSDIRVDDDIDTAIHDYDQLKGLDISLGCRQQGHVKDSCVFKTLHELVDQRAADVDRFKAEGKVPSEKPKKDAKAAKSQQRASLSSAESSSDEGVEKVRSPVFDIDDDERLYTWKRKP